MSRLPAAEEEAIIREASAKCIKMLFADKVPPALGLIALARALGINIAARSVDEKHLKTGVALFASLVDVIANQAFKKKLGLESGGKDELNAILEKMAEKLSKTN